MEKLEKEFISSIFVSSTISLTHRKFKHYTSQNSHYLTEVSKPETATKLQRKMATESRVSQREKVWRAPAFVERRRQEQDSE